MGKRRALARRIDRFLQLALFPVELRQVVECIYFAGGIGDLFWMRRLSWYRTAASP